MVVATAAVSNGKLTALKHLLLKKGFDPVKGPPSFPGANFSKNGYRSIAGVIVLGLQIFFQSLKLCHDEKPCTWWLGEKGLGSPQSRLARMLHHEYDAPEGYRFVLEGSLSFYSVSWMYIVIFNHSLLNWSSHILTVAHIIVKSKIQLNEKSYSIHK